MRVALIYNLKRDIGTESQLPVDYFSEYDSPKTVQSIADALRANGCDVLPVEADAHLPQWLRTHRVDLAFNVAEGAPSENRESHVPALLSLLGIPHTGSGALAMALALDKAKTKQILRYEGIPTPAFQVFRSTAEPLDARLHFPLIVKPNREGSAKGITVDSVVRDRAQLRRQVHLVLDGYRQEALVEEFISGRELTVGVLANGHLTALPILEIDFAGCEHSGEYFYSWRMKEYQGNVELGLVPTFHCPARLPQEATRYIQELAIRAHRVLGCADISRTDFRLRDDGTPFVLEVNPLPGLDPEESNFPMIARGAGMSYQELIHAIVASALSRARDHRSPAAPSSHAAWTLIDVGPGSASTEVSVAPEPAARAAGLP